MEEVAFYEGDLREYRNWRIPERLAGMVERAARVFRSRSGSDPIEVYDADGLGESLDDRAAMGPIRYGPPGRLLSVLIAGRVPRPTTPWESGVACIVYEVAEDAPCLR